MTSTTLSGVFQTPIKGVAGKQGITEFCENACKNDGSTCLAFIVDYNDVQRCFKLDSNSNDVSVQLVQAQSLNYFEKVCLRGKLAIRKVYNLY